MRNVFTTEDVPCHYNYHQSPNKGVLSITTTGTGI